MRYILIFRLSLNILYGRENDRSIELKIWVAGNSNETALKQYLRLGRIIQCPHQFLKKDQKILENHPAGLHQKITCAIYGYCKI